MGFPCPTTIHMKNSLNPSWWSPSAITRCAEWYLMWSRGSDFISHSDTNYRFCFLLAIWYPIYISKMAPRNSGIPWACKDPFKCCFACVPVKAQRWMLAWQLYDFRTNIARKPYILWFFRGGVLPSCLLWIRPCWDATYHACVILTKNIVIWRFCVWISMQTIYSPKWQPG